jgi:hypothetical protein
VLTFPPAAGGAGCRERQSPFVENITKNGWHVVQKSVHFLILLAA